MLQSRMRQSRVIWALLLGVAGTSLIGCKGESSNDDDVGDDGDTGNTSDTGDTDTGEPLTTTYWQDVAPIYYENCVTCHREGGIGPFVLDDYQTAATWASASAMAVENRVMPPWLVTSDGSCGDWANSKALEQHEIDTILAWVDAGAPEGEPRDDLSVPELPGLGDGAIEYSTPEFVPEPQGGVFAEFDEYRCFLIDPALEQDMFMTGYEVVPGNEALVHHVLAMPVDPDLVVDAEGNTNLDVITALDEASPDRLGWDCFGAAGDGVAPNQIPVTWAPGQGVVEFPAGSGARLSAGDLIVIQVHYNMADPEVIGQSDSSTVRVRLEESVEREGFFDLPDGLLGTLFTGQPDSLPPGEQAYDYVWTLPASDYLDAFGLPSLELWGFFPHMHSFGTKLKARVLDQQGNEVACMGDVPRWDFGWQLYYFYEQPIVLGPEHTIEVTCTFDTSGVTEPILPGWGTHNEMCLAGIYLVP